ncbi:MAG: leucine-rich repeat domain-containing protein [Eubacteriaceae bacterium]|nr:leucine-rich repeat domain-containing protein [Eubacteriaceae bacterium]
MSIKTELQRIISAKDDIISKIRNKGVEVPEGINIDSVGEYIDLISSSVSVSVPDPTKEILFYDYDGSLLYSFSPSEISSLTELPLPPSHTGLTFQEWNWSLDELKTLGEGVRMNVGAVYITDDESTRLEIDINDDLLRNVTLAFNQSVSEGVSINWGDGSAAEKVSGTGNKLLNHNYSSTGTYTISLLPTSVCNLKLGHTLKAYNVLGDVSEATRAYSNMLRAVYVGRRVAAVSSYAFQYCRSLEYITLPNTVTSMGNYSFNNASSVRCVVVPKNATNIPTYTFGSCYGLKIVPLPKKCTTIGASSFRYCHSLSSVTLSPGMTTLNGYAFSECYSLETVYIPESVTSMGNFVFYKCHSLNKLTIPDHITSMGSSVFYQNYALAYMPIPPSVTTIGTYAFYDCHAITSAVIPAGLTEIKAYAFQNCHCLKNITVLPTTPPTMGTSAFLNIPDDCVITVPTGTLAAYQAAGGWSDVAVYMVEG